MMQLAVHSPFQIDWFVNHLFCFSITVKKNHVIQIASCVLALNKTQHAYIYDDNQDGPNIYLHLFTATFVSI